MENFQKLLGHKNQVTKSGYINEFYYGLGKLLT